MQILKGGFPPFLLFFDNGLNSAISKVCGGRAVIIGTRITVSSILEYYQQGMSIDELLDEFDYSPPSHIHAALSYYSNNRDEIEREIEQVQKEEFWQEKYPGGKMLQK